MIFPTHFFLAETITVHHPTDLSLASHQFLAKYGLESKKKTNLAGSNQVQSQPKPSVGHQPTNSVARAPTSARDRESGATQQHFERLLDITAIRQQSKLL